MEDTNGWMPGRLETGVIQCGDDWPGVFIRGDNALMGYAPALARILAGQGGPLDFAAGEGLLSLLRSCRAGGAAPQQVTLPPPPVQTKEDTP